MSRVARTVPAVVVSAIRSTYTYPSPYTLQMQSYVRYSLVSADGQVMHGISVSAPHAPKTTCPFAFDDAFKVRAGSIVNATLRGSSYDPLVSSMTQATDAQQAKYRPWARAVANMFSRR
jgi:hypothetical protein